MYKIRQVIYTRAGDVFGYINCLLFYMRWDRAHKVNVPMTFNCSFSEDFVYGAEDQHSHSLADETYHFIATRAMAMPITHFAWPAEHVRGKRT